MDLSSLNRIEVTGFNTVTFLNEFQLSMHARVRPCCLAIEKDKLIHSEPLSLHFFLVIF